MTVYDLKIGEKGFINSIDGDIKLSKRLLALGCINSTEIEVKKVAPILFKNAGPSCVAGPCPEGKMCCGKLKEMRTLYLGK